MNKIICSFSNKPHFEKICLKTEGVRAIQLCSDFGVLKTYYVCPECMKKVFWLKK